METEASHNFSTLLNKKRKRFLVTDIEKLQLGKNYPINSYIDDQDDKGFDVLEELSNNGITIKKIHNKLSHKITITEEKVSNALRELQIEGESFQKEIEAKSLVLTNELKNTINRIEEDEIKFSEKLIESNLKNGRLSNDQEKLMQIIPWSPNVKVNPVKEDAHKSNEAKTRRILKKCYQPKISIKELDSDETVPQDNISNNYFVEFDEDRSSQNSLSTSPVNQANVYCNITEVSDEKPVIDEEMMDL